MARCNCGGSSCQCLVLAGTGTEVTGSGNVNDPYIISNTGLAGAFLVEDTATVDLTVHGAGNAVDPYVLSAQATVGLLELEDRDTTVAPADGYVPVWRAASNKWSFGAPPVAPAGSTNTANGIRGIGSVGDPVAARTSGTWGSGALAGLGSNSLIGQPIYVDSAGDLRAAPLVNVPVDWSAIQNKPAYFPTTWDSVAGKPDTFASSWSTTAGKPKMWFAELANDIVLNPGQAQLRTVSLPAGYFTTGTGAPTLHVGLTIIGQAYPAAASGYFTATVYTITSTTLNIVVRNVSTSQYGTAGVAIQVSQVVGDRF